MIAQAMQVDVVEILSTFLSWFVIIVIVALIIGAAIFFLKIYFLAWLIGGTGPRREPTPGRQCPYCHGFTPQESRFCKNCGGKL